MTIYEKNISLLKAFGIPGGDGDNVEKIRGVHARLLASGALRLANLQTARDIVELSKINSPEVYLFLAAMFVSERKGNAFMREKSAVELLEDGGYLDEDDTIQMGFPETNEKYKESVKELFKEADAWEWKNDLVKVKDVIVHEEDRWFFQRDNNAVKELNRLLSKFKEKQALQEIPKKTLEKAEKFALFTLNDAQKAAVEAATSQRFTIITGGPGTGKTTTVCAILRALFETYTDWTEKDIALAAPTGRAAQRMQEAILHQCEGLKGERICEKAPKLEGSTIHRLLGGYAPNWAHDENNPLEKKVVIVDETSMADMYLMQALLRALPPQDARLILLGDADQLPSVETGAVLGDLTQIGLNEESVKRLGVCERNKGEISEISKKINDVSDKDADVDNLIKEDFKTITVEELSCAKKSEEGKSEEVKSEFRWFDPTSPKKKASEIKKAEIMKWYTKWMSGSEFAKLAEEMPKDDPALAGTKSDASVNLFKKLNSRRILTLVREGKYGVKEANAHLLKEAKGDKHKYADYLSIPGVPIMVTKNSDERRLFNGDVGITVRGPHGMVVLFPRGEKTIVCPVSLLPEHELAYAMTVHKSQGSEYDNVMVVLPDDEMHPLLNRQIVYTGITRAKKRAVIVGMEKVLKVALVRKLERNTGIELG